MKKCIVCNNKGFFNLLKMKNIPSSAQILPTQEQLSSEKGEDLKLVQCKFCGLVQFDCNPVSYYKDVIRSGGTTKTMRDLKIAQYEDFISRFNLDGKKIIEIGTGRGDYLQFLKGYNVQAFGIENNIELVKQAKEKNLDVEIGFADGKIGKLSKGPFDAFLSFNFLEHQPYPNQMIQDIYQNTTDDGVGLITVPSLEYILENNAYYELIKDHIAYYSFETLEFLLNKNGFIVVEKEIVNRDTLSVYVKKRKKTNVDQLLDNTIILNEYINNFINNNCNKKIALWGASHQGFTIASTSKLNGKVEYFIDSAIFKQGKYSPASHIKIVAPEYFLDNPVDIIIIIAPGYTDEIYTNIRQLYGKEVKVYCIKSCIMEEIK